MSHGPFRFLSTFAVLVILNFMQVRRLTVLQVQNMLREELRAFTRAANDVDLIGAARTDAGVHALNLPAHFDLPLGDLALKSRILATGSEELLLRWNRRLPPVTANTSVLSISARAAACLGPAAPTVGWCWCGGASMPCAASWRGA